MAGKLISLGSFTVTSAGTRVQLTGTYSVFSSILIQADDSNTGKVYIGDSSVSSSNRAISLAAGDAVTISGDFRRDGVEELTLTDLYIDASANSQAVYVSGLGKR